MSDKNEPSGGGSTTQKEAAAKNAQPVARIIEAFGGLRPMAGKLKVAVSTVQGWKERDSIPTARHAEILSAAKANNISLDPAVLSASDHMTRNQAAKTAPTQEAGTAQPNGSKDQDVKKDDTSSKTTAPTAVSPAAAASDAASKEKPGSGKDSASAPKSTIPPAGAAKTGIPQSAGAKAQESKASDTKAADSIPADKTAAGQASAEKSPAPKSKPSDTKPVPQAKSGGGFSGFVLGIVVLALVLAGAVYSRNHWLPLVETLPVMAGGDTGGTEGAAEAAAERITALETQLAALEDQVQSASGAGEVDLSAVDQAIADANKRIDALDGTLEQLLAGGVVIAADGEPEGETTGAAGSVLDSQELATLKAQVDQLAGRIESGSTGAGNGQVAPQADAGALTELAARLDEIEETVTGLEDPAERLSDLDSRLSAAERGVAAVPALESRLTAELTTLSQSIPTGPSEDAGDAAMFLALLQLRQALSGSGSFESELALVEGLVAEDAELKSALMPLAERAGSGIAGLPGLQVSFDEMAGKVVAASRGGEEGDWVAKTLQKVSEAVTIRPVGLVEGEDAGAVLARSEVKLEAGDLAGAVAELDGLTGAAAEGAAAWRAEAEARLGAQKALSLLAARAATLIGLGG